MHKHPHHKNKQAKKRPLPVNAPIKTEPNSTPTEDQASKRPEQEPKRMSRFEKWYLTTAICGVVAAIFVLLIYYFQLREMQKTVRLTEKQILFGQRANLVFREVALQGTIKEGEKLKLSFKVQNTGATPATDIETSLRVGVDRTCPPDERLPERKSFGLLGAGRELTHDVQMNEGLTRLQADDILLPTAAARHRILCLHGVAHYKDIFGGLGEVTTCSRYNVPDGKMIACETGNDMKWQAAEQDN